MKQQDVISRRDFIKRGAGAAIAMGGSALFGPKAKGEGKSLHMGIVGCGGRGTHDTRRCLEAAQHLGVSLKIAAAADAFKDKAVELGQQFEVPKSRCFGGFDAYRKLLECEVDLVLLCTPPIFRPLHFETAVAAGKHVFVEKPIAVDPPGARKFIEAGEVAASKGLSVVAGTQRRHQRNYRETQHRIAEGAIGDLTGGAIYWCGGRLWFKRQQEGEDAASYLVRNWVSFTEMSGDHIVEQHVHNVDVANWFIGSPPATAIAFGGRARRVTGNQYDFFSVDFDYGKDVHVHSMCRQINACYNRVSEFFTGTNGTSWGNGGIKMRTPVEVPSPDFPEFNGGDTQQQVDFLKSILEEKPVNEARQVAEATLAAIMGRIAAYTGKMVRWKDVADAESDSCWCNLTLEPTAEAFEEGPVPLPPEDAIPLPGEA